jgi:hypothetical protein
MNSSSCKHSAGSYNQYLMTLTSHLRFPLSTSFVVDNIETRQWFEGQTYGIIHRQMAERSKAPDREEPAHVMSKSSGLFGGVSPPLDRGS